MLGEKFRNAKIKSHLPAGKAGNSKLQIKTKN